jgi:hypothetical protein
MKLPFGFVGVLAEMGASRFGERPMFLEADLPGEMAGAVAM